MAPRRSNLLIFRWPLVIGVASAFGLVAALVADDAWDWLAAMALAAPVLLTILFAFRSSNDARSPKVADISSD
jgi:hypothetical protein